jgi:hypothetical protein
LPAGRPPALSSDASGGVEGVSTEKTKKRHDGGSVKLKEQMGKWHGGDLHSNRIWIIPRFESNKIQHFWMKSTWISIIQLSSNPIESGA